MIKRQYGKEIAARNQALNLGISPKTLAATDPDLWRSPRILVPIHVEALVVEASDSDKSWAKVKFNPHAVPGYSDAKSEHDGTPPGDTDERQPEPFDEKKQARAPGIYLHWSLPDGLTQGVQTSPVEDELPPAEHLDDNQEHAEPETPEDTEFPLIPDRWAVVRMYRSGNNLSRRRAKGWIIESEQSDPEKRVTPLPLWEEDRSDDKPPRWLTAVGEGDPAYAAYYDNVENILTFHDSLADIQSGPVSYLVVGWYSSPGDDPLFGPMSQQAWLDKLDELGWALEDTDENPLAERLRRLAEEAKELAEASGKNVADFFADEDVYNIPIETGFDLGHVDRDFVDSPDFSVGRRADDAAAARASSPQTGTAAGTGAGTQALFETSAFNPALSDVAFNSEAVYVAQDTTFLKYWPRQTLCHAMIYDVVWNGIGGRYDSPQSGVPTAGSINIAAGNTGAEAISALVAEKAGDAGLEKVLSAFTYGMLPELQQPDGIATLESLLHAEDFDSKPGGFKVDTIEEGDLFPHRDRSESWEVTQRVGKKSVPDGADRYFRRDSDASETSPFADKTAAAGKRKYAADKTNVQIDYSNDYGVSADYQGTGQRSTLQYSHSRLEVGHSSLNDVVRDAKAGVTATPAAANPRRTVPIRKAMPRYWQPKDPVILLSEARRSYKHGEDDAFTTDGKLNCRLTGDCVRNFGLSVARGLAGGAPLRVQIGAEDIVDDDISTGYLPPEVNQLFCEALLLDQTSAPDIADRVIELEQQGHLRDLVSPDYEQLSLKRDDLMLRVQVEQTLPINSYLDEVIDEQALNSLLGFSCKMPVPFSVMPWQKPWTPLHLDWEVEWLPAPNGERDWSLGEHDFATSADNDALASSAVGDTVSGRTLLTPGIGRTLADRVSKFLEQEQNAVSDEASTAQEADLVEIAAALKNVDILSTSLDGFHDFLLARVEKHHFQQTGEAGLSVEETYTEIDGATRHPVRAGHLRFKRLRIIDGFGQFYDFDTDSLNNAIKSEDVKPATPSDVLRMPPRIVQPSRLMFRMLSAVNDGVEATKLNSPVCGWLLPDHLDSALEIYDGDGFNLGQVQRHPPKAGELLSSAMEWQGVPGKPGPFGGEPQIGNPHVKALINGLLARGEEDAAAGVGTETASESALSALLRMIDATLWTVDPLGREGSEHLSVLVGRPLAVVRTVLRLEVEGEFATEELARTPFPVRLGQVTRLGDGLIGYYVNDDYSQFYPVHEEIANQSRATRPHQGFLGAVHTVNNFYENFEDRAEPVVHPYINTEPTVWIRPGQSIMLTLLVDPRGGVHATSGILPRKRIELMREHVATALDNITITFRVGPVLSDPNTIRMPLPAEIKGNWSWVRRTDLTVWEELPIVNATPTPNLSPTPAEITEGWLKLGSQSEGGD